MFPSSGGDGPNKAPPGDRFEQLSGRMSWVWGKLAYHVPGRRLFSPIPARGCFEDIHNRGRDRRIPPILDEPLK